MRKKTISTFYDERMVLMDENVPNISKSPLKPKKIIEYIHKNGLLEYFDIKEFEPFEKEVFYTAHFEKYVDNFFNGIEPQASSNGLKWNAQFADSVRYTNASIYNAIFNSIKDPDEVSFSNTAGFHHATPDEGMGFCTFSGQVIASLKIYRELGLSGAYLDLDGHFGNSLEDSRYFAPDLNEAVPTECNINPQYHSKYYIIDLQERLKKPFPLALSLFGGYRKDDYNSVLSLHLADLVECLNILCDNDIKYKPSVIEPRY